MVYCCHTARGHEISSRGDNAVFNTSPAQSGPSDVALPSSSEETRRGLSIVEAEVLKD